MNRQVNEARANSVFTYLTMLNGFFELTSKEIEIADIMIRRLIHENDEFRVETRTRKYLMESMGTSYQTINNYLSKFRSKKLLDKTNKLNDLLLPNTQLNIIFDYEEST
jgi:hypothetical protein